MIGWIIDPREGESYAKPRKQIDIVSYNLPVDSIKVESGSLVTTTKIDFEAELMWVKIAPYANDVFWVISATSEENGITTISINTWMAFLNNEGKFYGYNIITATAGNFFCSRIPSIFPLIEPGILSSGTWATKGRMSPPYVASRFDCFGEDGYYKIYTKCTYDILHLMESQDNINWLTNTIAVFDVMIEHGWVVKPVFRDEVMTYLDPGHVINVLELCFDQLDASSPKTIVFDDGHSFVTSQSYEKDVISVCDTYAYNNPSALRNPDRRKYQLLQDGTIYLDPDNQDTFNDRCQVGDTVIRGLMGGESDALAVATAVFAENNYSHKIVFESDKDFVAGQAVKLVLDRGVVDSVISKVEITNSSRLKTYTCGDIPVTATQKINAQNWKYGTRMPFAPKKGQLLLI